MVCNVDLHFTEIISFTEYLKFFFFFFTPLQDCLENITTKVVPFTIMVGYVCKIVFSSLFWVLFDFEFVCFLVGGLCWLLGLCDCKLGVGFGAGFVCFLVGGYLFHVWGWCGCWTFFFL